MSTSDQNPQGVVIEELHEIKSDPAAVAAVAAAIRAERLTDAPRGPYRIACPRCNSPRGIMCTTAGGNQAESIHAARWDEYKTRIRSEQFVVRVRTTDARLGVITGELYEAQLYTLDPEKVSLLRRIPDGYDPRCNQYWGDVDFERWSLDA